MLFSCPFCFTLEPHSAFLGFDVLVLLTCSPGNETNWREEWLVKLSGAKILEISPGKGKILSPSHPLCSIQGLPELSPASGEGGFNFCHEHLTHPSSEPALVTSIFTIVTSIFTVVTSIFTTVIGNVHWGQGFCRSRVCRAQQRLAVGVRAGICKAKVEFCFKRCSPGPSWSWKSLEEERFKCWDLGGFPPFLHL